MSRNKREGRYGGKVWASEGVKALGNGKMIWERQYSRHARYKDDCFSLRYRSVKKWNGDAGGYFLASYKGKPAASQGVDRKGVGDDR